MTSCRVPRLVVAGAGSGVGKTTLVAALARAFRARGLRVALYKCGPDYLDPTILRAAGATVCHNLDPWLMGPEGVRRTFAHTSAGADLALIEGVMGLYDGLVPEDAQGSTAEVARLLAAPVLVVVDGSGVARTLAALVQGLVRFPDAPEIGGVWANRLGSLRHRDLLAAALASVSGPPLLGGFPSHPESSLPERHLGLVTARSVADLEERLATWAELAASWGDLDRLLALARTAPALPVPEGSRVPPVGEGVRVAYADDEAFHFYYPENLALLREAGAELLPFSPLHDPAPPPADLILIGGGYPEVHAERLAANERMRTAIAAWIRAGRPLYAECGGLIYLARALRWQGERWPMCGRLPAEVVVGERLVALGYVEATTTATTILGPAGMRVHGHQFRYGELEPEPPGACYELRRPRRGRCGRDGYRIGAALAAWTHLHWARTPEVATALLKAARGLQADGR